MNDDARAEADRQRTAPKHWQPDPSDGWLLFLAIALGVLVVVLAYPH